MNIEQLLLKIKQEAPVELYDLEAPADSDPVVLSLEDIRLLVDFAVANQPKIRMLPENKTVDMLTLLLGMGTADAKKSSNPDRFLGQKDARIEQYIIEKAKVCMERVASSTQTGPVVCGLSGNPPTINHLIFIQHLMSLYSSVRVILNAQSTLKTLKEYAPAEERINMLKGMLDAEGIDPFACQLGRHEIDRDPPSRMIGTLSILALQSNEKSTLALGMDGLLTFTQWYKWQDFGKLCSLKFYPRDGVSPTVEAILNAVAPLVREGIPVSLVYRTDKEKEDYEQVAAALGSSRLSLTQEPIQTFEGSSTKIREYYAQSPEERHPEVHPVVDQSIRRGEFYGYTNNSDPELLHTELPSNV